MNIATTRGTARSSLSLPNILTCARIAAIPVVIGCIFVVCVLLFRRGIVGELMARLPKGGH